jgi:murein DD-endopeptidase MepM/ murein hydrolase activator NlpD
MDEQSNTAPRSIEDILADMNSDRHRWHNDIAKPVSTYEVKDEHSDKWRKLLTNIGICIVIVASILLLKSINAPFAKQITGWVTAAFTTDIDIKDTVGQLKFVQDILPEFQQQVERVFSDINGETPAQQTDAAVPPVIDGEQRIDMIAPVNGQVTSKFGKRVNPIFQKEELHTGIDIDSQADQPVVAVADGTVIEVGENGTEGRYVRIKHSEEVETLYAHAAEILVKQSQQVRKGDIIAKIGNSGLATGTHLHFEVWYKGQPVDPLEWINIKNQSSI